MALTTLDRNTALILIDLQNSVVSRPTVHPIGEVVQQAVALADAFCRSALPVVLVNVAGGAPGRTEEARGVGELPADWIELIPELSPQPGDHTVTKRTRGAFTYTGLDEHLKDLGVTQVVVAGVSTSGGVESTARQAYEYGFNVTLATDAMTDLSLDAHTHSITRVFPRLGETGTTQQIIALLDSTRS